MLGAAPIGIGSPPCPVGSETTYTREWERGVRWINWVQRRRDSRAALRLMRKLLKKQGFAPKLADYRQAAFLRFGVRVSAIDLPA